MNEITKKIFKEPYKDVVFELLAKTYIIQAGLEKGRFQDQPKSRTSGLVISEKDGWDFPCAKHIFFSKGVFEKSDKSWNIFLAFLSKFVRPLPPYYYATYLQLTEEGKTLTKERIITKEKTSRMEKQIENFFKGVVDDIKNTDIRQVVLNTLNELTKGKTKIVVPEILLIGETNPKQKNAELVDSTVKIFHKLTELDKDNIPIGGVTGYSYVNSKGRWDKIAYFITLPQIRMKIKKELESYKDELTRLKSREMVREYFIIDKILNASARGRPISIYEISSLLPDLKPKYIKQLLNKSYIPEGWIIKIDGKYVVEPTKKNKVEERLNELKSKVMEI